MADGASPAPLCALGDNQTAPPTKVKGVLNELEEHSRVGSGSEGTDNNERPLQELTIDWEQKDDELLLMQERLARADLLPWPNPQCNQDADTQYNKEPPWEPSDGAISSLSLESQLTSPSFAKSAVSSIEMSGDTNSEASMVRQYLRHPPSDVSEGASDALELDGSVSTVNGARNSFEDHETQGDLEDGDAYSLPSSISSISSLSSTSPRLRPRTKLDTSPRDHIENIPPPPARDSDSGANGEGRDGVRYWHWDEFVKPEALSSLSSGSDIDDLDVEDSLKDDTSPATLLIEPLEKRSRAIDLFSRKTSPALSPVQPPTANDAYVGFEELRNIFHELFPHRDALVLDVGCGTSSVCRQLVLHGFSNVHGVDVSAPAIAFQRQEAEGLEEYVQFFKMNAAAMAFPESLFDCVFTKAVLDRLASSTSCHWRTTYDGEDAELLRVLSEITRCLRPGGLWICVSCQEPDDNQHGAVSPTANSWWDWTRVKQLLSDNYVRVKTYRCGTPFTHHGKFLKPFAIQIYRNRETASQKLERLVRLTFKSKQLQRQIDVRDKWRREQQQQLVDLQVIERELPAMLAEDHRSKLVNAEVAYERRRCGRAMRRATLYAQIAMRERLKMEEEDALAECVRVLTTQVTEFARSVMLARVDALLSTIDASPKDVAGNRADPADKMETTSPPSDICKEVSSNDDTINVVANIAPEAASAAVKDGTNSIADPIKEAKVTHSPPDTCKEMTSLEDAIHVVADIVGKIVTAAVTCIAMDQHENEERKSSSPERILADRYASSEANASSADTTPERNPGASVGAEAVLPDAKDFTNTEAPTSEQDENLFSACGGDTADASASPLEERAHDHQGRDDCSASSTQTSYGLGPELADKLAAGEPAPTPTLIANQEEDAVGLCLVDMLDRVVLPLERYLNKPKSEDEATANSGEVVQAPSVTIDGLKEDEAARAPSVGVDDVLKGEASHCPVQSSDNTEQHGEVHERRTAATSDLLEAEALSQDKSMDVDAACQVTMKTLIGRVCLDRV